MVSSSTSDGFQKFENHAVFRQQRGIVAHQKIPRAVQKCAAALREALDSEQEKIVGGGSCDATSGWLIEQKFSRLERNSSS